MQAQQQQLNSQRQNNRHLVPQNVFESVKYFSPQNGSIQNIIQNQFQQQKQNNLTNHHIQQQQPLQHLSHIQQRGNYQNFSAKQGYINENSPQYQSPNYRRIISISPNSNQSLQATVQPNNIPQLRTQGSFLTKQVNCQINSSRIHTNRSNKSNSNINQIQSFPEKSQITNKVSITSGAQTPQPALNYQQAQFLQRAQKAEEGNSDSQNMFLSQAAQQIIEEIKMKQLEQNQKHPKEFMNNPNQNSQENKLQHFQKEDTEKIQSIKQKTITSNQEFVIEDDQQQQNQIKQQIFQLLEEHQNVIIQSSNKNNDTALKDQNKNDTPQLQVQNQQYPHFNVNNQQQILDIQQFEIQKNKVSKQFGQSSQNQCSDEFFKSQLLFSNSYCNNETNSINLANEKNIVSSMKEINQQKKNTGSQSILKQFKQVKSKQLKLCGSSEDFYSINNSSIFKNSTKNQQQILQHASSIKSMDQEKSQNQLAELNFISKQLNEDYSKNKAIDLTNKILEQLQTNINSNKAKQQQQINLDQNQKQQQQIAQQQQQQQFQIGQQYDTQIAHNQDNNIINNKIEKHQSQNQQQSEEKSQKINNFKVIKIDLNESQVQDTDEEINQDQLNKEQQENKINEKHLDIQQCENNKKDINQNSQISKNIEQVQNFKEASQKKKQQILENLQDICKKKTISQILSIKDQENSGTLDSQQQKRFLQILQQNSPKSVKYKDDLIINNNNYKNKKVFAITQNPNDINLSNKQIIISGESSLNEEKKSFEEKNCANYYLKMPNQKQLNTCRLGSNTQFIGQDYNDISSNIKSFYKQQKEIVNKKMNQKLQSLSLINKQNNTSNHFIDQIIQNERQNHQEQQESKLLERNQRLYYNRIKNYNTKNLESSTSRNKKDDKQKKDKNHRGQNAIINNKNIPEQKSKKQKSQDLIFNKENAFQFDNSKFGQRIQTKVNLQQNQKLQKDSDNSLLENQIQDFQQDKLKEQQNFQKMQSHTYNNSHQFNQQQALTQNNDFIPIINNKQINKQKTKPSPLEDFLNQYNQQFISQAKEAKVSNYKDFQI